MFIYDIEQFLIEYTDLLNYISNKIGSLKINFEFKLIDSESYFLNNFSNIYKVYQLFYSEHKHLFYAIPIYDRNIESIHNIDEWPIYRFDLCSTFPLVKKGNFKSLIKQLLSKFIHMCKNSMIKSKLSMYKKAKNAVIKIDKFSDNLIDMENYELCKEKIDI